MFEIRQSSVEIIQITTASPVNLRTATRYVYMSTLSMGLMKKETLGLINIIQPIFLDYKTINDKN